MFGNNWKEEKKNLFELTKINFALYKNLRAHTNCLEYMVNEHGFMNLVPLKKN